MNEVVRKEVLNRLETGTIYPISNNPCGTKERNVYHPK